MKARLIPFLFFSNYFIGFLAIALSVETVFQLRLPMNSFSFYLLLFSATVVFYTRAYIPSGQSPVTNPRTRWYRQHHRFIRISQIVFLIIITIIVYRQVMFIRHIPKLPVWQWFLLLTIPLAATLYYGMWTYAPRLRNIGWLKPFLIGYVWAGAVVLLPVSFLMIEEKTHNVPNGFMLWLFLKNWMFCAVNAILFDLKDYADDANKEIKTFVVRAGLRKTIFLIIIPLLLTGFISFILFASYNHFGIAVILINALPFLLLIYIAFTMQQRKNILYYLVVIDGVLLVKACCGIAASLLQA